jgi:hypothetical protein
MLQRSRVGSSIPCHALGNFGPHEEFTSVPLRAETILSLPAVPGLGLVPSLIERARWTARVLVV